MRVALITGATGGLGEEIAKGLDSIGIRVIINFNKSRAKALRLKALLKNTPYLLKGDIALQDDITGMRDKVERDLERLDIIINNAGITADQPLMRLSNSAWESVIETNLTGIFRVTRAFMPLLIKSGRGHIINISSWSGIRGREGQTAYSASKAALIGLSKSVAGEAAGDNIMVNTVVPGYLPVGLGAVSQKAMEQAGRESLTGEVSDPANVVEFIKYLTGTQGITGQVFNLENRV